MDRRVPRDFLFALKTIGRMFYTLATDCEEGILNFISWAKLLRFK